MATMLQLRGTCPACHGEFQLAGDASAPVVGKHGWQEEGGRQVGVYGRAWHSGECFGVGWAPFELSPEGTWAYLTQVVFPHALSLQGWLDQLANGTPTLTRTVYRQGKQVNEVLTPTNEAGAAPATYYRQAPDGAVESVYGTVYEGERIRETGRTKNQLQTVCEEGARLVTLAQNWVLAPVKDGTPKGPTVHFKREGARLPYCGSKSHGLYTTAAEMNVTCSRCVKAIEAEHARQAAHAALEADAATVTEYLRANGRKTKADLKKGLGWDAKRLNRALDQAERPWRDGKTQPGTVRSVYNYPKPESFEAA